MSIEELNTACFTRRVRLSRERRTTLFATLMTFAVFSFVIIVAYGGFS